MQVVGECELPGPMCGSFLGTACQSIRAAPGDVSCSGRLALGLQKGWPGINWIKWHLAGAGLALLAKANAAEQSDDIPEELFLQLEGAAFILLDAEQKSEHQALL